MARYKYTRKTNKRRNSSKTRLFSILTLIIVAVTVIIDQFKNRAQTIDEPFTVSKPTFDPAPYMEVHGNENLPSDIVEYDGMTISFNNELHIPNWVAWELTKEEALGKEKGASTFKTDPDVVGCPSTDDYKLSGYDRGHMAPAADMKLTAKLHSDSYYLTNITPQVHELNAGAWKSVEDKCRARVTQSADSAIIIICGPVPNEPPIETIGASRVHVPQRLFKVIYAPHADEPYTIGFIMPNQKVHGGMQTCAVTVDSVEAVTGYDFFSALPDSIENIIESKINFDKWSKLK